MSTNEFIACACVGLFIICLIVHDQMDNIPRKTLGDVLVDWALWALFIVYGALGLTIVATVGMIGIKAGKWAWN